MGFWFRKSQGQVGQVITITTKSHLGYCISLVTFVQILSSFHSQYPLPSVFFLLSSHAGFISVCVLPSVLPVHPSCPSPSFCPSCHDCISFLFLFPLWPLKSPNRPLLLPCCSSLQPAAQFCASPPQSRPAEIQALSPCSSEQCDPRGCIPIVCYGISSWEWHKQFIPCAGQTLVSSLERSTGSDLQHLFRLSILVLSLLTV